MTYIIVKYQGSDTIKIKQSKETTHLREIWEIVFELMAKELINAIKLNYFTPWIYTYPCLF